MLLAANSDMFLSMHCNSVVQGCCGMSLFSPPWSSLLLVPLGTTILDLRKLDATTLYLRFCDIQDGSSWEDEAGAL